MNCGSDFNAILPSVVLTETATLPPPMPMLEWTETGQNHRARWRSENRLPPPKRVLVADDSMTADAAYKLACEGTALLWRGDFQNARQLLQAMARRIDRKSDKPARTASPAPGLSTPTFPQAFHLYRQAKAQRARTLGMLLLPLGFNYDIALSRAPDVRQACTEAWGPDAEPDAKMQAGADSCTGIVSLREVLGLIGGHEWRKKGIEIPAAGGRIHPHYGVFAPVRNEYVKLLAEAPWPAALASSPSPCKRAFDIGTGTGVLAAVLARRGVARIIAADRDPRAVACARDNLERLGLAAQVEVMQAELFPEGRAELVLCNPPWVPARAGSPLDHAIYDPDSRMLLAFLGGLAAHLEPGGEGWLVLSDLAEHLALRSRDELLAAIDKAGLIVVGRTEVRPQHPRASDRTDSLHAAREAEVTSLWRLAARP